MTSKKSLPTRGMVGYINGVKKSSFNKGLAGLIAFLVIYFGAYFIWGTNKNYGTIIAVLIILPTAQSFSRYIGYRRYKSFDKVLDGGEEKLNNISLLYELIVIRGKKNMFIDIVAIVNDEVILFLDKKSKLKQDNNKIRQEIQTMLNNKGIKTTVKVIDELDTFMSNISDVTVTMDVKAQERIAGAFINSSM